ncbi:unnamed protein product [Coregonus sp. 'balchen']|nr:unnamed protein product [Coregonus sp. 'balchen']
MEQFYTEVDGEARQDYQSTRDDIKNRLREVAVLRIQLEGTVERLWHQFKQALRCYNEATENRHMAFKSLRTFDQQMRRLQKMQLLLSVPTAPLQLLLSAPTAPLQLLLSAPTAPLQLLLSAPTAPL